MATTFAIELIDGTPMLLSWKSQTLDGSAILEAFIQGLIDSGLCTPLTVEGGVPKQLVQDNNSEQLLTNVLKELQKLNLHMSFLTDINITNQEIS